MYLFFDTETTGLPKKWKEPVTNLDNWPRLVQIAWLSYNEFGELLSSDNRIIKPNGFIIPEDASKIHGITHENADLIGEDLAQVLTEFKALVDNAKYLVAHNMSFDEKIVGALCREPIKYCMTYLYRPSPPLGKLMLLNGQWI